MTAKARLTSHLRALAALAGALAFSGTAAAQPQAYAWVQLGDGGRAEVRAAAEGASCPRLSFDHRPAPMQLRAAADARFPAVCEAAAPAHARYARVDGVTLRLPKAEPRRIVVIGDTGCRLKGLLVQACNDPHAWPFATVARHAAAARPDLIIHVGDYYYRENACPALAGSKCAGSPHGDAWPAWEADFFGPARPLLEAAPWVFVRGNHEDCARGGDGWFRLLNAGPHPKDCLPVAAPFTVPLGHTELYVIDSALADDRKASGGADGVARQLDLLAPKLASGKGWLVTHRPVWGLVPVFRLGGLGPLTVPINAAEQAAVRGRNLDGVQMVLSGHIHHFAAFDFLGRRPAQLIVGTGGDIGEKADSAKITRDTVMLDGAEAQRLTFERFGYFVLDRAGDGWVGTFRDVNDRAVATCRLNGRRLSCGRWRAKAG